MIVALKAFTMRGVRYGPPARPDFYRQQLAEAESRLAALDQVWEQGIGARIGLMNEADAKTALARHEVERRDLVSVCERLQQTLAEEELEVKQIVPKAEWDKLPKHKQQNMIGARWVAQREGRKLQEA